MDRKVFEYEGETDEPGPISKTVQDYSYAIYKAILKFGWIEEQPDIERLEVNVS